jgi:hypothetical protein
MTFSLTFLQTVESGSQKSQIKEIQAYCRTDRQAYTPTNHMKLRLWWVLDMLSVVSKMFTPGIYFIVKGPSAH